MINYKIIRSDEENPSSFSRENIADFLYEHLDEYGDDKEHILACISYAYGDKPGQDGFIIVAEEENRIVGSVIINHTNMSGYIPEHILVYIAVDHTHRGKGIGKALMEQAINYTEGDIALHVEPENPALHLYKKFGFTNKYLEMRLSK